MRPQYSHTPHIHCGLSSGDDQKGANYSVELLFNRSGISDFIFIVTLLCGICCILACILDCRRDDYEFDFDLYGIAPEFQENRRGNRLNSYLSIMEPAT